MDTVFSQFVYWLSGLASYLHESGVIMETLGIVETLGIDSVDTSVSLLSRGSGTGEFGELWKRLSCFTIAPVLLSSSRGVFSSVSSCLSARLNGLACLLLLYSAKRLSATVLFVSPILTVSSSLFLLFPFFWLF